MDLPCRLMPKGISILQSCNVMGLIGASILTAERLQHCLQRCQSGIIQAPGSSDLEFITFFSNQIHPAFASVDIIHLRSAGKIMLSTLFPPFTRNCNS